MPIEFPLFVNSSDRGISLIEKIRRNVFVGDSILFLKSFSQLN